MYTIDQQIQIKIETRVIASPKSYSLWPPYHGALGMGNQSVRTDDPSDRCRHTAVWGVDGVCGVQCKVISQLTNYVILHGWNVDSLG